MAFGSTTAQELASAARWDPEFFDARYRAVSDALIRCGAQPLRTFVSNANRGTGPIYDPSGTVRVINSVNVRELELSNERQSRVTSSVLAASPSAAAKPGDLVVTSTGIGTLGRTFCIQGRDTLFADGHITILKLKNPAEGPFLSAFLQSPLGRIQYVQRRRGSSRQVEIYPEDILSVLIPPLASYRDGIAQEWIAAVEEVAQSCSIYPDAENSVLNAIGWKNIKSLDAPNHYTADITELARHRRFDAEFYSPRSAILETELLNRNAVHLRDFISGYVKGVQPAEYSHEGRVIVIKSKDVVKDGINLSTCDRAQPEHVDGEQGMVAEGMLLVNMTGVGTLGRAAVMRPSEVPAVVSVDVSAWSINPDIIPVEYIALFLNSAAGMAQTTRQQTGSSGQLHLYPGHIRDLLIYVKRTRSGIIDREWHEELAAKVKQAAIARTSADVRLRGIHNRIGELVGLNPRIYRE